MKADLHLHTTASDGLLSPAEMVREAAKRGMQRIAVTDHDTVSGLAEAQAEADRLGLEMLCGLELSVGGEEEIHLLAYGVDPRNPTLLSYLDLLMQERAERSEEMLRRLNAAGFPLTAEDITNPQTGFSGRSAAARALVARGLYKNTREAFENLLLPGKPGFVPRKRIGVESGCEFLCAQGAFVVLAHPGRMKNTWQELTILLPLWQEAGLRGLEAWHSSHSAGNAQIYERYARSHGLYVTGGSDSHGKFNEVDIAQGLSGWRDIQQDTDRLWACVSGKENH